MISLLSFCSVAEITVLDVLSRHIVLRGQQDVVMFADLGAHHCQVFIQDRGFQISIGGLPFLDIPILRGDTSFYRTFSSYPIDGDPGVDGYRALSVYIFLNSQKRIEKF